jgi:predicted glycoside hydrolase/deacetylase ChbG (UPF0249 family)
MNREPEPDFRPRVESASCGAEHHAGLLIVNADDWGRDRQTTGRILDCVLCGTVSSVSAMVFMEDSERAAAIARERGIDAGLHLNFTTPFSSPARTAGLLEHQRRVSQFLLRRRLAPVVFHPGLARSFQYVAAAQREEFARIYGQEPSRFDGHHHMHLCANVLLGGLLPSGTVVRRNFSFWPEEKSWYNRAYRKVVDGVLARRHRLTDYFFSLAPLVPPTRLQKIFSLARLSTVEAETHPANQVEYRFLTQGEIYRQVGDLPIAPGFALKSAGDARHR